MSRRVSLAMVCAVLAAGLIGHGLGAAAQADDERGPYLVLGYNDLGMHCMNQDFSEFMILPPYNNLHAQVIERTPLGPRLVTSGINVTFSIPGNTESASKTNFWTYVQALLGAALPPNVGLAGNGLTGAMQVAGTDWVAAGIPLTPQTDFGAINTFQLANIMVTSESGTYLTETNAVVPVSWELRCDLCHHGAPDAPVSVLDAHDRLHGTTLFQPGNQPVLCGGCHAQPELGLPGQPGVSSLSVAMHRGHAPRMMDVVASVPKGIACYACHPGPDTQCLRDTHAQRQIFCANCHAPKAMDVMSEMLAVGDPARRPWMDMPRCDNCHHRPGYQYEQPGMLFKNSVGHGGLACEACHNSTHAVLPARDKADNLQAISVQKNANTIRKCSACHAELPVGIFRHAPPPVAQ